MWKVNAGICPNYSLLSRRRIRWSFTAPIRFQKRRWIGSRCNSTLGYVSAAEEVAILSAQQHNHPIDELKPAATLADVLALKRAVENIRISDELKRYAVDMVAATRTATGVQLGASPRASIALMKISQALALFDGFDFVTPEQVQSLAVPVIAHRLVLEPSARFSGVTARGVVEETVKKLKVPA